ncbi:MAGUK p55 subfamily member 4-like isoform X1 [Takifugu rubripes]|uniref:MAGUK p55 subfamily member 4-like isoform X1 n=2 Tax=Takifugu rubripes TaxID=31033 RepID=UPI001145B068|nr:MAGUK p55 subfamily member 4-like isoform X1 [Takifugu rubripes]XP_029706760.1 MAGUK p55 subfamily member 4-like isoform X1 [Takifugu rubripes]XP_029706769.1 MAGUK p55 subfamily member 4-like isoform X1 [Takifugu rubripes]
MKQDTEDGVSAVLLSVVEDMSQAIQRKVSGAELLYDLLSAPWLQALLKIYESLLTFQRLKPSPILPYASGLSQEIMVAMETVQSPSVEVEELYSLLSSVHIQALLSSHDSIAQVDYSPILPPLPDDMPDDEEAFRIVCLVKNNQPLGATIRKDEGTGEIFIARVIHGGLADRSGLLHPGDLLVEVNGNPVVGLDPEQVIQILINSQGTILFKVVPNEAPGNSSTSCLKAVYIRAMVDYCPLQDASIPCPDAGMAFRRGDLLEVVDQSDESWWQARKLPWAASCAGLIPSASRLKSKQREQWWSQPSHVHTCIRALTDHEDDLSQTDDKRLIAELEETHIDDPASDVTDGIYLAGFRRSFCLWRRTSHRRRRQSCTSCSPTLGSLSSPYEEVRLYQRLPQEKQRLIVLTGASGVGVNELRKRLIKLNPLAFQGPVPHTTRPIRAGQLMEREYHFVTKELFDYMMSNHRFVEYGEFKGHLYGTSVDAIDDVLRRGQICIVDVEPHNIQMLRTPRLKPYVIFIKPPSPERLRETRRDARIISSYSASRAFTEDDFVQLEEASQLMEAKYRHFFDRVLVNEDLHNSCMELFSFIQEAQQEPQWTPVSWNQNRA